MKTKIKIIVSLVIAVLSLASCSEANDPTPIKATIVTMPNTVDVVTDFHQRRQVLNNE